MNIRHPGDLLTRRTRTVLLTCVSLSFLSGPAPAQTTWFQDDFDVPQLSSQWHPVTGAWQVKDGILTVTTREYDALAASTFYTYPLTPYAIEVRLRGIRAGVYFSLDDTTTKNYSHMVRFDEKSILTGYFNGAGEFVATNMFDVPAAPKEWTTLKVAVDPERQRYEIYSNGTFVGADDRLVFPSGYVGLQGSDGLSEFHSITVSSDRTPLLPPRPRRGSIAQFQHVSFVRAGPGNVTIYNPELKLMQALDLQGKTLAVKDVYRPPTNDRTISRFGRRFVIDGPRILLSDRQSSVVDTVRERLVRPAAIVVDSDTTFFVADAGAGAIHHFDRHGRYLTGLTARSIGGFIAPRGLDLLGKDELVIADYNRLVIVNRSLKEHEPEVNITSPSAATLLWPSPGSVKPSVTLAADSGTQTTVEGSLDPASGIASVQLTGLQPLKRYTYTTTPPLKILPAGETRSREYRFCTPPLDQRMMACARLPLICLVYRTISYRDVYPRSRFPQIPDGRTLSDDDLAYLKEGAEFNREFYFRNSGCKLVLDFDFSIVEDTLWLRDVGDQDPYWLGPTERVAHDFKQAARRLGKRPEYYAGMIVPYAWANYPPRRTSVLADPVKQDTISIRQAYGGGTLGVPAPWKFGRTTGYTSNPFQDRFSRQDWLITHEFHHQLDALLEMSGYPEYYHADQPWKMPGRFGEDFDFNAQIIRNARPEWWLNLKFGNLLQTLDADRDGVPDDDPSLPFDEIRLHGSAAAKDTDGDGLSDLREVMVGTSRGTRMDVPDSDKDGMNDALDTEPLYTILPASPSLQEGESVFAHPFADLASDGMRARLFTAWTNEALVFAYDADTTANLLFQIDALADGWFHGFDNIQIRVANTRDSASVLEYYLRDCSSWTEPPQDRKNILKTSDLTLVRSSYPDSSRIVTPQPPQGDTTVHSTLPQCYRLEVRVPRLDTYGFSLHPGKRIAVRCGLQTAADRWVWHELFERNYMMVVELR